VELHLRSLQEQLVRSGPGHWTTVQPGTRAWADRPRSHRVDLVVVVSGVSEVASTARELSMDTRACASISSCAGAALQVACSGDSRLSTLHCDKCRSRAWPRSIAALDGLSAMPGTRSSYTRSRGVVAMSSMPVSAASRRGQHHGADLTQDGYVATTGNRAIGGGDTRWDKVGHLTGNQRPGARRLSGEARRRGMQPRRRSRGGRCRPGVDGI